MTSEEDLAKRKQNLIHMIKGAANLVERANNLRRRFGKGTIEIKRAWQNPSGYWEQFYDHIDTLIYEYENTEIKLGQGQAAADLIPKKAQVHSRMQAHSIQTKESIEYEAEDERKQENQELIQETKDQTETGTQELAEQRSVEEPEGQDEEEIRLLKELQKLQRQEYTVPSAGLAMEEEVRNKLIEKREKQIRALEKRLEEQTKELEFYKQMTTDSLLTRDGEDPSEAAQKLDKLTELRDVLEETAKIESLTNPLSLYYRIRNIRGKMPDAECSPWKRVPNHSRHPSQPKTQNVEDEETMEF